jgi:pimeloyl-ACP methyl ester carboxylesterase
VLAGHSFGGALALQLAVDYPKNVAAVVSLAGTIAAPFQKPKWYKYLAEDPWIQTFLSEGFLKSNREMMLLSKDLYALTAKLKGLDLPIYLLQGGKDILVNPGSPFYLLDQFNRIYLRFNSQWDHFIIWTEREEVSQFLQGVNL